MRRSPSSRPSHLSDDEALSRRGPRLGARRRGSAGASPRGGASRGSRARDGASRRDRRVRGQRVAPCRRNPESRRRAPLCARKGEAVLVPVSRARGRLPRALRAEAAKEARVRSRLLEQVGARAMRAAEGEVRPVRASGLPTARRARRASPSQGGARDGRLSHARRRHVLVPRRRLRQGDLAR